MPKPRKSESLFGDQAPPPSRPQAPRRSPEEIAGRKKEIQDRARDDYIFRGELKKVFNQQSEMHRSSQESGQNSGIIRDLEIIRSNVSQKEIIIVKRVNQRRKRHYLLNGDICVYCYVKNLWPKLIIKPLTIRLDSEKEIPLIDGYDDENEFVIKAIFKPITLSIRRRIDPFIFDQVSTSDSGNMSMNLDEYKKLSFRCCFKKWNLPITVDIDEKDGLVNEKSWKEIEETIHPKLFDSIMGEFISLNDITEEEEELLDQQSERLFSKDSTGVSNPSEGIRLYCEASVFAKEFSISGKGLDNLSYKAASMMRYIANKGGEIHARQIDSPSKNKGSKQATPRRR